MAFIIIFLVFAFAIYTFWYVIDLFIIILSKSSPEIPSGRKLKNTVISEINKNYKNLHTVIDIGSCYGELARRIARECDGKKVVAVENMPQPALVSKITDLFSTAKSRTVWADAMKYIKKSNGFDIGTAYLYPNMMTKVEKLFAKFKVLIVLDFPLPNTKPTKKVKLHRDHLGQHYLYVYENKRNFGA